MPTITHTDFRRVCQQSDITTTYGHTYCCSFSPRVVPLLVAPCQAGREVLSLRRTPSSPERGDLNGRVRQAKLVAALFEVDAPWGRPEGGGDASLRRLDVNGVHLGSSAGNRASGFYRLCRSLCLTPTTRPPLFED